MRTLAEILNETSMETPVSKGELANPNGQRPPSSSSPKISPQDDGRTASDIIRFTEALSQACIALHQYGKSPAELKAMRDMFLTVLADIPAALLTKALFVHLNISDTIPTPKQLREIVYPPVPEWKPDWPYYIALKKKIHNECYFPLSDERSYLRQCEAYSQDKRRLQAKEPERTKALTDQPAALTIGYEGDGDE